MTIKQARAGNEAVIHATISTYLRAIMPTALVVTINNNPRNAIDGAKQKRLGMIAGTPDIMVVREGGWVAFLEVKREGGRLNPAQVAFRDRCAAMGIPYAVVRTIPDVDETLASWGLQARGRAA